MAEDPKNPPASDKPTGDAAESGGSPATNVSPAPAEAPGTPNEAKDKGAGNPPPAGGAKGPPADALSDGTVPTVLTPGASHRSVSKGKASLTGVYRKADVITTLITFAGALVAAGIVFGVYFYLTRNTSKPVASPGKVSTLNSSDLSKLGSFFSGNSAGNSSQILTINSSTLFKNLTAVDSDLKVTGGLDVGSASTLSSLTVNQISNLGVTNVRGQLTVTGPVNLQSPTTLSGGGTVKGDLAVSGNGNFGGSMSAGTINAATLTVTGTLNLNGHLSIGGQTPSASGVAGVSSNTLIQGDDSAGSVSVTTLATSGQPSGTELVTVHFHSSFPAIPVILITPIGRASALLQPYVIPGADSFTIGASTLPGSPATVYTFNYWVVQY